MLVLDDIEVGPCLVLKLTVVFLDVIRSLLHQLSLSYDHVSQYLLISDKFAG